MARKPFVPTAALMLALTAIVAGCGGGGDGGNPRPNTDGRAVVRFYGPTGNSVLGQGLVETDGTFPATAPVGATRFSVDLSTATDGSTELYYDTYQFNGNYYDNTVSGCYPTLPQAGSTAGIQDAILFYSRVSSPPPPPPTGCNAG